MCARAEEKPISSPDAKDRLDQHDVRQVRAAVIGIVGDEEVARPDAARHRSAGRMRPRTAWRRDGRAGRCPARSSRRRRGTARSRSRAPPSRRRSARCATTVSAISSASVASAFLISSSANGSRAPGASALARPLPCDRVTSPHPSSISIVSQAMRRTLPVRRHHGRAVVLLDEQRARARHSPSTSKRPTDRRVSPADLRAEIRRAGGPPAGASSRGGSSGTWRSPDCAAGDDAHVHGLDPLLGRSGSRTAARARASKASRRLLGALAAG